MNIGATIACSLHDAQEGTRHGYDTKIHTYIHLYHNSINKNKIQWYLLSGEGRKEYEEEENE
jgi:vancomycin permeability regulator SanA